MLPTRIRTNDLRGKEPTSIHWTVFAFDIANICIIFHWNSGHFTISENEWNRRKTTKLVFPRLCPLKSKGEDFKNGFQIFQFSWILLVPKHSLLKYFTLTFTRHKSSKFEGSGPPWTQHTPPPPPPPLRSSWLPKVILIFRRLISLCSISNESISSLSFSCGHDLQNALWGVGAVSAGWWENFPPYECNINFLISICTGERAWRLCSSWHLAQIMPPRSARVGWKLRQTP